MLYTHKISFDLSTQKPRQRIAVVYGSRDTVAVEIALFDGTIPWIIPNGSSCVIRFVKANGNGGVYHSLTNGMEAWEISGNCISIRLIPEAMDCSGLLDVSVVLVNNGRTFGIYGFDVHAECNLPMPLVESEDYFDFKDLSEINTAFVALQMKTDVDETLALSGRPADSASVGAALAGKEPAFEDSTYPGCYYRTRNGLTEWINPPMGIGVEYRTTERYQGKPVYALHGSYLSQTEFNSGDTIMIPTGIANMDDCFKCCAKVDDLFIPVGVIDCRTSIYQVVNGEIQLTNNNGYYGAGFTVSYTLYYTKTTD